MSGDFVLTERLAKRIFDIAASSVALVILSPLIVLSALAIRLESRGPIFFRQERVGQFGKKFQIIKLRTMAHRQVSVTAQVTSGDDQRITRIGRFLRRTKIDETPQFLNVLRGEMSIVGPRPEVERFVSVFPKEFDEVLSVRPGITDLASISFVDEEARLRGASDVEKFYVEAILPEKLKLQKAYVQRADFLLDMKIILWTVAAIFGYRRFKT